MLIFFDTHKSQVFIPGIIFDVISAIPSTTIAQVIPRLIWQYYGAAVGFIVMALEKFVQ
jgi:hypothetical protein